MRFLFLGSLYPLCKLESYKNDSKNGLDNAANNFQWSIIGGLDSFCNPLRIVSLPALKSFPKFYKKYIINNYNFSHNSKSEDLVVGYYNFPLIKHFSKVFNLYKYLNSIELKENSFIFVYSIHSPFLIALSRLKNKYKNLKICLIVPDLPQFMSGNKNPVYRFLKWIDNYLIKKNLENIDCFVLLTKSMQNELKIINKPFVIVEGISNDYTKKASQNLIEKTLSKKRVILYTGSLSKRYGIINLLDAFKNIKSDNYELWICGSGDASKLVESLAKQDERVKFYGHVSHDEVINLQNNATVLVNPRTSEGEYTKFSFPSKTLEYLSSGTPTILHRLEGIPEEYYEFCYVAEEQSSNGLKETILFACEKDDTELVQFGKNAQEFVLKNKNARVQTQKIKKMIESNFNIKFNDY